MEKSSILIDVWSDFVCPFCYIGKRHLEEALRAFPERDRVKIQWRSFELDPNRAKEPERITVYERLAKKYGRDVVWAKQTVGHTVAMAAEAGLKLDYERAVPANTFNAHRLLHLATQHNQQDQLEERLMKAYFTEGLDINDAPTLTKLGSEIGLKEPDVATMLAGDMFSSEVRRDEEIAQQVGIRGVPFFLFNREIPLSGAQPVETFAAALEQAAQRSA